MIDWAQWRPLLSAPPLGHVLRAKLSTSWVRIHNLPLSRRLPEGREDESELLYRNNLAASCVLGVGALCLALQIRHEEAGPDAAWEPLVPPSAWLSTEDLREEFAGASCWARELLWSPGCLDGVILPRARGETGSLAVLSSATHGRYVPYDGGADLFLRSSQDVSGLKELLKDFLAPGPMRIR